MTNKANLIFTFQDQQEKTAGYIELCTKTWHKYTPDNYEIVVLNKQNLKNYISAEFLDKNIQNRISNNFSNLVYEYIETAVLYCNGGIFLSPGTIMTNKFAPPDVLLSEFEIILYGSSKTDLCNGFMMARKNADILEELLRRLTFFLYLPQKEYYKPFMLLKDILKEDYSATAAILDCESSGYLMEKAMYGVFNKYLYEKYYFSNLCSVQDFIKTTKGLTFLQTQNTPKIYKNMSKEKFLQQEILLSGIFKLLLQE